jgi:hypothetical protein
MSKYTMMGASEDAGNSTYDNSGINPNPSTETPSTETNVANSTPIPTTNTTGSGESVNTSDIPNTPDNIAEGQKETSYAMLLAAIALAFIFLKKKKK